MRKEYQRKEKLKLAIWEKQLFYKEITENETMSNVNERISTKRKYKKTHFLQQNITLKSKCMETLLPQYTETMFYPYTVM